MHDEKRGERYFSMHRLTGAELTKLISYSLWIWMLGFEYRPCIERRRILSQLHKAVKQEKFFRITPKLKRYLRLASLPCFISSQFVDEAVAAWLLNSR
jgi:hypothetical protein